MGAFSFLDPCGTGRNLDSLYEPSATRLDPLLQPSYRARMAKAPPEPERAPLPLLRRSPVSSSECNLARSFELIGDRWTLLVLRSALYGVRRFADFQADLGAPRSILSDRLARLVDNGLLEPRDYQEEGQRARSEYFLTDMGRSLALPFMAMTAWGDRWLGGGKGPLGLKSKTSGQAVRVAYVDEKDHAVPVTDVGYEIAKPAARRRKASRSKT
jgi:DNA-binding HxlR family transcriptional regulator